ncbi:MAG: disulfide bond formation protein B [Francisellaceae bacterium]
MTNHYRVNNFVKFISALEILGICLIIGVAFFFQYIFGELPCPLCLLQRLGLLGIAFGFLLNMRYRVRPSHYALSLLSAVITSFIALRQISLHITTPEGYGSAFLGMHMYTWVFVICMIAIVYIAIAMSFPQQYEIRREASEVDEARAKSIRLFTHIVFLIFFIVVLINAASLFLECGVTQCPDNPEVYKLA